MTDDELRLLIGSKIDGGGIPVYKISVKQMAEIGYTSYLYGVHIICADDDQIFGLIGKHGVNPFEFVSAQQTEKSRVLYEVSAVLKLLTHEIPIRNKDGSIQLGQNKLTDENFPGFQSAVKKRCSLESASSEDDYNPSNAKAAAIIARSKELAKKMKKDSGESDLTVCDLVSIVASKSGKTLEETAELDLYQLGVELRRYKKNDDYDVGIEALMNGAKPDDVKLKHWISAQDSNE